MSNNPLNINLLGLTAPPPPPPPPLNPIINHQTLPKIFSLNLDDINTDRKWVSYKEDITDYFNYGYNE